ncbi:MAG TPA: tRNA uridine-5-carboxymethylaminomethyl(34) synthesis GTPase MnmE [Mariprofundaceae bacterium]|nr:tRNA uridine-5-carboxymethylaminomethyl(34) synthesis GTPase MnmE [Mariprofundaceae bacterium]
MTATIAAVATPPGRGGVGIIRLSGPDAVPISLGLCRRESVWRPRHAHCTRFLDHDGEVIDEGLLLYFPAPFSYTGEDVIECQIHGSPVLLESLLRRLFGLGAVAAEPGAFTRRAVENGKMDLSQAEAVVACIDAATERAARQAQRHLQGEFGRLIEGLMHELTDAVAHIEACLDFPEEEIPDLLSAQVRRTVQTRLLEPIEGLLARASFGERLFDGARIAIIGAPNVGKSSLMNVLSGRDRAIVSDTAGTTRDVLELDFEVHGIPVRLLDTAGLRVSGDAIEQEGVRRARHAAGEADVVVFVADATRPDTWVCDELAQLRVLNKVDLCDSGSIPDGFLPVSARQGQGVAVFVDRLAALLGEIQAGEEGLFVTRHRHEQCLRMTRDQLEKGIVMLDDHDRWELVALEWRRAWSALGEIVGVGDVEFILDRVFSQFCIGK